MATSLPPATTTPPEPPGFGQAVRYWLRLGCISFGGPAGQIAMMHTELVDRRGWIDHAAFLRGLNFCTLLPGPEAQQLATYVGWRLHGIAGGVAAGLLFVVPGALVMLALSWIAAAHGDAAPVAAVFGGLKPVVVAIVAAAVLRVGRRALHGWPAIGLAAAAFVAMHFLAVDFPWVVLAAAVTGWLAGQMGSQAFRSPAPGETEDRSLAAAATPAPVRRAALLVAAFVALWAVPVAAAIAFLNRELFADVAVLFTQAAFVTFGGAYAVLPYVAERAVNDYGWLSAADMLNGLALAETTPGPLILVLQYVGFFAGWNAAEGVPLRSMTAVAAAGLTTYVTFLPSFLLIFLGAPYIDRLYRVAALGSALAAITAAVVGVVLNLAVFLASAALFADGGQLDGFAAAEAAVAFALLVRFDIPLHWMVAAGALIGLARQALG
jgi:chromate transporter